MIRMSEVEIKHDASPHAALRAEYEAVRGGEGAGLFDLSHRGRVELSGAEAAQFLNGMVTNDVARLEDGAWMPAAFPNPQGRLLASARIARRGQGFLIDTEEATAERVRQILERFTLAGDFRVRDISNETAMLSLQGAGARRIVAKVLGEEAASLERFRASDFEKDGLEVFVMRATHTSEDGYDLICATSGAETLSESLTGAGARRASAEALEILRVEAGEARYGVDADEANVALEVVRDEAVSFTKGCYAGQEIIARIHWRGHVAKKLAGLILETKKVPAKGSKVLAATEEKEAGRVTSAVYSPRVNSAIALAVIKYDYLKPDTKLRVVAEDGETTAARVAELPLVSGSWSATEETKGER